MKNLIEKPRRVVINGINYSTATAEAVATRVRSAVITETIFKTTKGKWFLYCEAGNNPGPIRPITALAAIIWIYSEGLPRIIGKHFPDLQDFRDLDHGNVVVKPLSSESQRTDAE